MFILMFWVLALVLVVLGLCVSWVFGFSGLEHFGAHGLRILFLVLANGARSAK